MGQFSDSIKIVDFWIIVVFLISSFYDLGFRLAANATRIEKKERKRVGAMTDGTSSVLDASLVNSELGFQRMVVAKALEHSHSWSSTTTL